MILRLLMSRRQRRSGRTPRVPAPESTSIAGVLLGVSIVMAVVHLPLLNFGYIRVGILAKVLAIVFLLAYAERPGIPRPLLAALGLSALADLLLALMGVVAITPEFLFLCGLGVFLLAHLCYILLFLRRREKGELALSRRFRMAVVVTALALLLWQLWPNLGAMMIPCVIYAVVLAAMAISAQLSRLPEITSFGALLFFASDAMLAWARFHGIFPFAAVLVWASYYAAQVCIARGVVRSAVPRS